MPAHKKCSCEREDCKVCRHRRVEKRRKDREISVRSQNKMKLWKKWGWDRTTEEDYVR